MLQKKVKLVGSMLMVLSLSSYASISSATNAEGSSFDIRLFNNTRLQSLHYSVTSECQAPVEGVLPVGDDNGKLIKINCESKDKAKAEIVVTDFAGHTIWDNKVSFWGGKAPEFSIDTVSLDSHYNVAISPYPTIHAVGFDIRS